ncbi:hypothetical protein SLS62_004673 [Diatrype stigma]|uniref:Uncharacterized protein n=1 Tax=Diatrype stigma TaxID=117547 RepID=A0AAN9V4K9_9PEZI
MASTTRVHPGKTKNLGKVTIEKQDDDGNWVVVEDFSRYSRRGSIPHATSSRAPISAPPNNADSVGATDDLEIPPGYGDIEYINNLELTFTNPFDPFSPAENRYTFGALPQASGHDSVYLDSGLQQSPNSIFNSATDFNQLLLYSIANGSALVHKIPPEGILEYLSRFGDVASLMIMLLKISTGPISTALAENMFQAAIEAKDKKAVEKLIATRILDINSIVCTHQGQQYTPIERAASLRSVDVVELLMEMNADVNKSLLADPEDGGALRNLLSSIRTGEHVDDEVVKLARKLIQKTSYVHPRILKAAMFIDDPNLVYVLASNLALYNHPDLWTSNLFRMIAMLTDEALTKIMRQCFEACEKEHRGRCLIEYGKMIDWALIRAAVHGHPRLVDVILARHTPYRSYQLFSAVIRGGSEHAIQTVLTMSPDLDGPTHSIEDIHWTYRHRTDRDASTSFSEAIKARDEQLTNKIANAGALSSLNKERRFELALAAAVETGNTALVRTLISRCKPLKLDQMCLPLAIAIEQDPIQEHVAEELIEAGACLGIAPRTRIDTGTSPLFAALVRRNRKLVHILLDTDLTVTDGKTSFIWKGKETCLLLEALHWGDHMILDKIRQVFPFAAFLPSCGSTELLQNGDEELFRGLHRDGLLTTRGLWAGLQTAIRINSLRVATVFLELGALVDDILISEAVEVQSVELLDLLLQNTPHTSECVPREFGTEALARAICLGPSGLDLVDGLLGSRLIDIHSPTIPYRDGTGVRGLKRDRNTDDCATPLGTAIEQCRTNPQYGLLTIRKLLQLGVNPSSVASCAYGDDMTATSQLPLLLAIGSKNCELVDLLISKGADYNAEAKYGYKRTPLQKAAEAPSLEIVRLLLAKGAKVDEAPATYSGGTAIQLAAISGSIAVACELLSHGARLDSPLPSKGHGRWPLEGAAEHGHVDMIAFLWKAAQMQGVVFSPEMCAHAIELARNNGHGGCAEMIQSLQKESKPASLPQFAGYTGVGSF